MPQKQVVNNLSGFMNVATTDELMRDSELNLALNVDTDFIGGVEKAAGYTQEGGTVEASEDPRAMHGFYEEDGTRHHLAVYDQDIYENVSGTWTSRYSSLTADLDGTFETYLGYAYYSNGTDQPVSSADATTWSTTTNVTNMPKGKYLKKANGLLYVANLADEAGLTGQDVKVWYNAEPDRESVEWNRETGTDLAQTASSAVVTSASASFLARGIQPGDPFQITTGTNTGTYTVSSIDSATQITLTTTLTNTTTNSTYSVGGNWFEVRDGLGSEITGLAENNNRLIVFKEGSMHRWDESSLVTVSSTIGTPTHRSIQTIDRQTFFFHRGRVPGVYLYDGRSPVLISKKVEAYLQNMSSTNYENVWSMADDQKYYLWIGNVSEGDRNPALNNVMLVYDRYQKVWHIRDDIQGKIGGSFIDSNGVFDLYFANTAEVYKFNDGTSNDTRDISFELQTRKFEQQTPYKLKRYKGVWITSENGEGAALYYRVGRGDSVTDWKPLGQLNHLVSYAQIPDAIGTWVQFKINESGTQTGPKIKSLTMEFEHDKDFGT